MRHYGNISSKNNNQEVRLSDSFGVVTGVILGLLFDC